MKSSTMKLSTAFVLALAAAPEANCLKLQRMLGTMPGQPVAKHSPLLVACSVTRGNGESGTAQQRTEIESKRVEYAAAEEATAAVKAAEDVEARTADKAAEAIAPRTAEGNEDNKAAADAQVTKKIRLAVRTFINSDRTFKSPTRNELQTSLIALDTLEQVLPLCLEQDKAHDVDEFAEKFASEFPISKLVKRLQTPLVEDNIMTTSDFMTKLERVEDTDTNTISEIKEAHGREITEAVRLVNAAIYVRHFYIYILRHLDESTRLQYFDQDAIRKFGIALDKDRDSLVADMRLAGNPEKGLLKPDILHERQRQMTAFKNQLYCALPISAQN